MQIPSKQTVLGFLPWMFLFIALLYIAYRIYEAITVPRQQANYEQENIKLKAERDLILEQLHKAEGRAEESFKSAGKSEELARQAEREKNELEQKLSEMQQRSQETRTVYVQSKQAPARNTILPNSDAELLERANRILK